MPDQRLRVCRAGPTPGAAFAWPFLALVLALTLAGASCAPRPTLSDPSPSLIITVENLTDASYHVSLRAQETGRYRTVGDVAPRAIAVLRAPLSPFENAHCQVILRSYFGGGTKATEAVALHGGRLAVKVFDYGPMLVAAR